jgi:hypothetical protein
LSHISDNGFADRRTIATNGRQELPAKFASASKSCDPMIQENPAVRVKPIRRRA